MSGSTTSLPEQGSGERERLGRFALLGVIGRGASATVYEAMDTRMERPVALKVLSFDPLLSLEQRQRQIDRFEREARAVARLSHPNIVSVFDVGEEDGKHFLVMELLSGVTLRERIDQGGPIALGEATSIVEQIAGALDCTHAEGIVHRDIKPSNVLLLPDGRVKMLDFGIARRGEDATVTHAGTLIGSPAYMSPEQGRGEHASPASDIWSLGALLYEMLTGNSPFGASNVAAVLYKAAYDKPEPLPDDAAPAQKVIDHALAKQPEERYATAGAMAIALRSAVESSFSDVDVKAKISSEDRTTKLSLQDAAKGAFIPASAKSTIENELLPSLVSGTIERSPAPRSRLADAGVLVAWCAVGAAALGIVTVRLRQTVSPVSPIRSAKSSPSVVTNIVTGTPAAVTETPVAPTPKAAASVKPPSVPPVRVVERKPPAPSVAKSSVVVPVPAAKATPRPAPTSASEVSKSAPKAAAVAKPRATATPTTAPSPKVRPAAVEAAEAPPWDARVDSLGDPEPEPEPKATVTPQKPPKPQEDSGSRSTETARFKESALLGRWQGNIWKRPATLVVRSIGSGSFQGILTLTSEQGPLRFPIQGTFSAVTGRVSFWATASPARATSAKIDLGQENGRLISPDTMAGLGVDSNRRVFTWSLSR